LAGIWVVTTLCHDQDREIAKDGLKEVKARYSMRIPRAKSFESNDTEWDADSFLFPSHHI
jgi:hypothetical protein